jgi:hypothetical protein
MVGGNWITRKKPLTCRKSLTNLMLHRIHITWTGFELTTLVMIGTDCINSCKFNSHTIMTRGAKRIFGPQGKKKTWPPPPILQIMILKLSPPRCVISKESVQQKWIDELWFRKQLSTCLFVWNLNYNDLVHLLNSWALGRRPGLPPSPSQWVWSRLRRPLFIFSDWNKSIILFLYMFLFYLFSFRVLSPMLPMHLDCSLLFAPSVLSSVLFQRQTVYILLEVSIEIYARVTFLCSSLILRKPHSYIEIYAN